MRDILRSGFKVGIAAAASLAGWVVAGKILALQLGAAGVGLYGLLRQLHQNLTVIASFNGQTALVQGIASATTPADQARFARSVLQIQGLICVVVVLFLFLGAPWLAPALIPHPDAVALLRWLAVALVGAVAQAWALGLLNGHRNVDGLVRAQLAGPVTVLVLVLPMVWLIRSGEAAGYVLMLAGSPLVVAVVAVAAGRRQGVLPSSIRARVVPQDWRRFFQVSTVMLAAAAITTGTQYVQSLAVARKLGLEEAGHYWTAWTLSMSYVSLLLGSYGTYYMPSLSRITDPEERRTLIRNYLRLTLLGMPLLVSAAIVFKPWVIRGVFSADLLPALKVMRWMLIGDLFKGISWVLAFPMLAYGDMKWFFWSESLFSLGVAGSAVGWLSLGGAVEGLGLLFFALYLLYLPVMMLYARRRHGFRWTDTEALVLAGGAALVGASSASTWQSQTVELAAAILLLALGACFALIAIRALGLASRRPAQGE